MSLVLYEHIAQCLTMKGVVEKQGRGIEEKDLGVLEDAALVADDETNQIKWVGLTSELPVEYQDMANVFSGEGEVWLPELVECHTHLVYGGQRHHDYALRCQGKSYQEVAQSGGGILSTLAWTRESTKDELFESALHELERFQKYGVGVIEIKSGYGLNLESEIKTLEVIQAMQKNTSVFLVPTFLPAHATPPEFKGRTDDYVNLICKEWIPEITKRKLAVFFDVFIEEGYFSVAQARKLCEAAKGHGLKLKLHCDQFTDLGGTQLGIELGASSIDHLDNSSAETLKALAESKTTAVLCPGASLFTNTPYANARALLDQGGRVALSTDYNPGTCPSRNLPLMSTIACSQMKMTIPEGIAAITYNAAAALHLEHQLGALLPGRPFRACQLKAESYEVLPYSFGELD